MRRGDNGGSTYNICLGRTREARVVILPLVVGVEVLSLVVGAPLVVLVAEPVARGVSLVVVIVGAIGIAIARAPLVVGVAVVIVIASVVPRTSVVLVSSWPIGHRRWAIAIGIGIARIGIARAPLVVGVGIAIVVVVASVVPSTSIVLVRSWPVGHGRWLEVHLRGVPYTKVIFVWTTAAWSPGRVSCKRGHSIELPKAGFKLVRCPRTSVFGLFLSLSVGLFLLDPVWICIVDLFGEELVLVFGFALAGILHLKRPVTISKSDS